MKASAKQTPEWQALIQHKKQLADMTTPTFTRRYTVVVTDAQAELYSSIGGPAWLRQRLDDLQAQMPEDVYNDPANHEVTAQSGRPAAELQRDHRGRLLPTRTANTQKAIGITMTDVQYNVYRTINGHTWLREELNSLLQQREQPPQQPQHKITKQWLQEQLATFEDEKPTKR